MALAIRCDQLLRSGAVPDASALARLARVSQPRMTQILDPVEEGKAEVNEKMLRRVCSEVGWERQRDQMSAFA